MSGISLPMEQWNQGYDSFIRLGQAYVSYLLDDIEPQAPGYFWAILKCLRLVKFQYASTSFQKV